jgi:hypothetical protein
MQGRCLRCETLRQGLLLDDSDDAVTLAAVLRVVAVRAEERSVRSTL